MTTPEELVKRLRDPRERFIFQGTSLFALLLAAHLEKQAAQLRERDERIKEMESNRDYWRGECIQSEQRVDALHRELKQRPIFMPTEEHFKRKLAKRDERIAELERALKAERELADCKKEGPR